MSPRDFVYVKCLKYDSDLETGFEKWSDCSSSMEFSDKHPVYDKKERGIFIFI